jgi:ABC-type dipeptide/oligopeptide/nickel transport system permease subunit
MALERTGIIISGLETPAPARRRGRRVLHLIRQNPLGFFGLAIVLLFGFVAIFGTVVAPSDARAISAGGFQESPSLDHFLGTDHLGRDMFSRVIIGSRISLTVGFLSVIFGTLVGTAIGIFSGYVGGSVDNFIQRTVDTAIAFPALLLLLILTAVMGPSMRTIIIAVGIAIIPGVARVVRGAVLSERNNQYVEAARALGASTLRILVFHITPNVGALSIVIMTTLLGTAILAEASLAFLGLGIPSSVTWGQDVNDARSTFPFHFWQAFAPGAAITLTVLGFNLLGDALRDIFDPRLRGRL